MAAKVSYTFRSRQNQRRWGELTFMNNKGEKQDEDSRAWCYTKTDPTLRVENGLCEGCFALYFSLLVPYEICPNESSFLGFDFYIFLFVLGR